MLCQILHKDHTGHDSYAFHRMSVPAELCYFTGQGVSLNAYSGNCSLFHTMSFVYRWKMEDKNIG